jgi:hypothetical protein
MRNGRAEDNTQRISPPINKFEAVAVDESETLSRVAEPIELGVLSDWRKSTGFEGGDC